MHAAATNPTRSITGIGAWRPLLSGLASGLLLWAMYPLLGLWPLVWLSYAPLLAWIERDRPRPRQALLVGWVVGTVLHAGVFSFLAFTLREMSGMPDAVGWLVVLGHAVGVGLHQAVFAALLAATVEPRRGAVLRAAQTGILLAVCEFALPWLFRWYLGNALFRQPLWLQLADVVGVIGVSAAAVAVTALLVRAWLDRSWRPLLAAVILLGVWSGYGAWRMSQVDAAPATGRFAAVLVQHNATLDEKRAQVAGKRLAMLDRLEQLTTQAERDGRLRNVDAVIWPEGAYPLFWVADDVTPGAPKVPSKASKAALQGKARLLEFVRQLPVPLLTGALRHDDLLFRDSGHNSALLLDSSGQRWLYDKRILLAFGEYLPGTALFPQLKGAIEGISEFAPGAISGLVQLGRARVLVNICYEALFAAFLRDEVGDAQVLINLTNDLWFGPPPSGELHLMVQMVRAIELRRPFVRSTVTGISAYTDAAGRILGETPVGQTAVLRADVKLAELGSPYRFWGDAPLWLATVGCVLWLGWRWRRRVAMPTD